RANWRNVVPESRDTLDSASLVHHQLIVQYLHDAHSVVRRYTPDGKPLGEVTLPGLGTTFGFAGRIEDTTTYFGYSDYTTPTTIYRLDLNSGRTDLWKVPTLKGFKPAEYQTQQVFYRSKDGTPITIF